MALLAEEIVEEWLNRQGYFTIRGIKLGVHEIDLLAVRHHAAGPPECRHLEVQASIRPISYISHVPKQSQLSGRPANSAKRSDSELVEGVTEWVQKKFRHPRKLAVMDMLCSGCWSSELVINNVKSQDEINLLRSHGITILHLRDIIQALAERNFPLQSAAGSDFVELIHLGASDPKGGDGAAQRPVLKHRSAAAGEP